MIVAGFGFRSGAGLPSLRAALELAQEGHPPVTHLATAVDKLITLAPLAEAMGLPLTGIPETSLVAASTPTRSDASLNARATGSVAEACALVAAGPGARLLGTRHISPDRRACCAIAQGTQP